MFTLHGSCKLVLYKACALQFCATSALMTNYHCNLHGAYLCWCQRTADCTTATTRRTKTVTATPNTAKEDYTQNAGHYTYG